MADTSRPLVDPMIRRVYKYPLRVEDETWVTMPFDAKVLAVQEQHGEPYLWALVFPSGPPCERRFRLAGTGHDIVWQENMVHRGTFQLRGGALVFHLFEYT
jgi:hypothetical protein